MGALVRYLDEDAAPLLERYRRAMAEHTCHAIGCTQAVPPARFMCLRHWRALPRALQDAVLRQYRPGQERSKRASQAYLDAAHAARHWLHVHEGLPGRLCVVCIKAGQA